MTSTERILAEATTLFAQHGYAGVTTRQLAAATGLNLSTIHHHVGSKRDLYLKVIEDLFAKEEALVASILDTVDDSVIVDRTRLHEALGRLITRLLDFAAQDPARQRLYMQRWLEPPDELLKREAELTLRLYRRLAKVLERGQELGTVQPDLDIGNFLRSFDFMIFSYFTSGAFNWRTLRADPLKETNLKRFREHLLEYTRRMLEN